ncbi:nuclear RNA polymerase C2 [Hibiscus trionum]|uniref:DNA-directed RNA polymerase n=1 Tax=Hibiscus trionum TaxID=183268 RepID=A0A9W7H918_HIBTR|nr:nuclear RNA polymerase C2 [Hibiscus trionum]
MVLILRYSAPILVNIEYTHWSHGQKTRLEKNNLVIGRMPIMLRSCCCVLYGKDEAELARLGECPLDPGGYFVIKGREKVILIQEQLSKNRIIIDSDNKGNINASVTSSSEATKSKTIIQIEREKIYLLLNQFAKKIPIIVIMKAMGMENDQEVVQMVGRDPRYSAFLLPSIEECAGMNIYTQEQALTYLDTKTTKSLYAGPASVEEGKAFSILRDVFLANVPVHCNNFRPKCLYVAVMLRRMMEAILNKDAMDDKDYVGNKCLELSGQLISLLFEDLFKTTIAEVKKNIDLILSKASRSSVLNPSSILLGKDIISMGLERTLSTGNFDIKRFRMHRKGMTEILSRLSFIGTLGFMTKVSAQLEKSQTVIGPRALQPSQWGMLCPCDTPEGHICGLVKNLALMTHVTTDEDDGPLISLCYCLGVEGLELLSGEELHTSNSFLVMLNGLILGKHRRPQHFAIALRKLRRAGKVGEFVSVFVNEKQFLQLYNLSLAEVALTDVSSVTMCAQLSLSC